MRLVFALFLVLSGFPGIVTAAIEPKLTDIEQLPSSGALLLPVTDQLALPDSLPSGTRDVLEQLIAAARFKGESGTSLVQHAVADYNKVILLGVGPGPLGPVALRDLGGSAAQVLGDNAGSASLVIPAELSEETEPATLVALGVRLGTYKFDKYKTEEEPAETPDLSKVLDEIISQPDWRSGNAMSFFVTKSLQRVAAAFESAPSLAASLSVTYLTRELAFERVSSGLLEVGRAEDGQGIQLTFDSPSPSAKFYLGLNYEFEASRDLIDWVPIRQDSFILGAIGEDGYGRLTATFDPDHFEGDEQFYVRMIVSLDPE